MSSPKLNLQIPAVNFKFSFVAITLYHSGTDGGKFDWVQVLTTTNKIYRCQIGVFMDGSNYIKGTGCTLVN